MNDVPPTPADPTPNPSQDATIADDVKVLHSMGYAQELLRRMSGFSNFAISFSIICILAGGITSFQLGFSSVGGAAIGIGWPACTVFCLLCALAMAQLASAFPTAGGLYHWASILGGRGIGWATAWFNLVGLITVLAAINVGTYLFAVGWIAPALGKDATSYGGVLPQSIGVALITFSQALFNHRGIKLTSRLTDFSGYLIFAVSIALTIALLWFASSYDVSRLWTFTNYSGDAGGGVWPQQSNMTWLFALGLLLPAYTITGFDASAHTAEETINAARAVPKGIINSVIFSGLFGWFMLIAVVLAMPSMDTAAAQGGGAFIWTMEQVLPHGLKIVLLVGISIAQYLCGLATVTSASRMTFAFARDGGLPCSGALRSVSTTCRTPAVAIWTVAVLCVLFTIYTPVYSTITVVCVIFLYISYLAPITLGMFAMGKSWTKMGPFNLGRLYRPIAAVCTVGCIALIVIGVQPPNDKALWFTLGAMALTAVVWFGYERNRFKGPPQGMMIQQRGAEIRAKEAAVGESL